MKDLLTGIVAAAFSAFYLMQTSGIKVFGGATAGVTAQTVPRLWGVAMLALSILLILRSILAMRKKSEQDEEERLGFLARLKERREVVCTFGLLILYAALMKPVGFIIMSILYVYLQVWVLTPPEKRTKRMHTIAGGLAVFFSSLYFVFTKYLMVMLPPGILK